MHRKLKRKKGDHSGPRGFSRISKKVTERRDSKYCTKERDGREGQLKMCRKDTWHQGLVV